MFSDVNEEMWSYQAIDWAYKNGIISGFPDGSFQPAAPLTREQYCVLEYKKSLKDGIFLDILPIIMPSVVMVHIGAGLGSGVCFKNDGMYSYILTNKHVVDAGTVYNIIKNGLPNTPANLIKSVPIIDLAVLQTTLNIPPCKIAEVPIVTGQPVCVVGSPDGLSDSVSIGIVSHTMRQDGLWFQTDAHINPGNSGGGIFNESGELVGISVAKMSDPLIDGIGFGIRLEHIKSNIF